MPFALSLGGVTFLLAVIWGNPLVEAMHRLRLGKVIRPDGPQSHLAKMGTPGMGGILIVGAVFIISMVVNIVQIINQTNISLSFYIPLAVMVAYSVLGGIDDYQGFRTRPGQGMLARVKIWFQLGIALVAALVLYYGANSGEGITALPTVPFTFNLPVFIYIPLAVIIIAGTANAVNVTDGLDGLAGIIAATCFAAYGVIAFLQGQEFLLTFCMITVGACFAFLWFNAKPAQMFMGDVGSQALGGALGVVALMTFQWPILPIIAAVPLATLASSALQVAYFKMSGGKRLFKMAPLHHHFELSGWSETQIVQRWWLITILCAFLGIALALV